MFYTYVLLSLKAGRFYIGSTGNLKRRIQEHNSGKGGEFTRKMRPFGLVFYEAFLSRKDAETQEKFYKSGYGREVLKKKIKNSLQNCPVV